MRSTTKRLGFGPRYSDSILPWESSPAFLWSFSSELTGRVLRAMRGELSDRRWRWKACLLSFLRARSSVPLSGVKSGSVHDITSEQPSQLRWGVGYLASSF